MAADSESSPLDEEFIGELRRAREAGARVPDFFVVGHAKCGTTALFEMLRTHPQIYMPAIKETQFLSRAPHERSARRKRRPQRRPQTLDAYLSLFATAGAQQRAGEGSTEYLRTPSTAGRIAALCPEARIVAAFREPASFLRSLHLQLLEVNVETERDFATAIALEEDRRRGKRIPRDCAWPQALLYSQHVRYAEQLREYHEHFGRERVLALIYDDFRADNEAVVREVLRFLEVDDSLAIRPTEANPTVRVRSQRAGELVGAVSVGHSPLARTANRLLKAVTSERVRRHALRTVKRIAVDSDPRAPDEAFMRELRQRYRHDVTAAAEYLDRDLVSLWGYDDVEPPLVAETGR
jgi:Sulfotransferase family